jgi:hypothetical protein
MGREESNGRAIRAPTHDMVVGLPPSSSRGKSMNMAATRSGVAVRLALSFFVVSACFGIARADELGRRLVGEIGVQESMDEIMARQAVAPPPGPRPEHELEYPDRSRLPQNPNAPAVSSLPAVAPEKAAAPGLKIHTTGLAFDGATLTDTGAFPPIRWALPDRRSSSPS